MSRKRRAPKKIQPVDPKFKSAVIPKLINSRVADLNEQETQDEPG